MPRTRSTPKPIKGDRPLFDAVGNPTVNEEETEPAPVSPQPEGGPRSGGRKNKPDYFAKRGKATGKTYRWYEIRGARSLMANRSTVLVLGCSDDDACGTYRVSKLYHQGDSDPVPTGRTKAQLERPDHGLIRESATSVVEVTWLNADRIRKELRDKRARRRAKRQKQAAKAA